MSINDDGDDDDHLRPHPCPSRPSPSHPLASFRRPHTHPDCGDGDQTPCDLHPTVMLDSAGTLSWQLTSTYIFYKHVPIQEGCSLNDIQLATRQSFVLKDKLQAQGCVKCIDGKLT